MQLNDALNWDSVFSRLGLMVQGRFSHQKSLPSSQKKIELSIGWQSVTLSKITSTCGIWESSTTTLMHGLLVSPLDMSCCVNEHVTLCQETCHTVSWNMSCCVIGHLLLCH